jgi:DNA ligase-1
VVIVPPRLREARSLRRLAPVRRAALTGWALDPWTPERMGCDTAFPLSDHCDFDDLVAYTLGTGAGRVYTLHGFAQDFARHLRSRGIEASALSDPEQLALQLA